MLYFIEILKYHSVFITFVRKLEGPSSLISLKVYLGINSFSYNSCDERNFSYQERAENV